MQRQPSDDFSLNPSELIHALRTHVRWLVIPTVVGTVLAAAYASVASREWRATQAFTVRADAAAISDQRLGKFSDLSEMKLRQSTILELAKSQSVLKATLEEVGPVPSFWTEKHWPSDRDIEAFRKKIDMRPPGGSEFGQSEVFYLAVLDTNRQRAIDLVAALSNQLERRMQSVRDERAKSMMAELEGTVAMAESDLQTRIEQLSAFEATIGADLPELRNLNALTGSPSELAEQAHSIEAERRANEVGQSENEQLLAVLKAAQKDPRQLIATPNSLLKSQPALSRLKDALVDAQVRTANLLGTLAEKHPFVLAAKESEKLVQSQLHDELTVAIKGLEMDLQSNTSREKSLQKNWDTDRDRLARLAAARAEYANLVAAVDDHTKLVEAARKNLADARADHAGAHSANVIGRIDGVEAGVRPVGPGRTTIAAAGGMAGLILGLGLVFLIASPRTTSDEDETAGAAKPQTELNTVAPRTSNGSVGLFRGMTLNEAIRHTARRPNGQHSD